MHGGLDGSGKPEEAVYGQAVSTTHNINCSVYVCITKTESVRVCVMVMLLCQSKTLHFPYNVLKVKSYFNSEGEINTNWFVLKIHLQQL